MGVPVLTLTASSFLSRQGAGILMNTGLADWVANSADDYVARAIANASDLATLNLLRLNLRQQLAASPMMNGKKFAARFGNALFEMRQIAQKNTASR
jgi:predicted O-linked N-acetylglucosamine transferase (SPINDLY family)